MKDVLDMLEAKVSEGIIIAQIVKANLKFTLSTQDLIALTKAGASEQVLHQLDPSIPISKPPENSAQPAQLNLPAPVVVEPEIKAEADLNDPDARHRPGMYLYTEKNGQRTLVNINKSVPQSVRAKTQGVLGWAVYAFLPRAKAVARTSDHQPVFYFYVGETAAINSGVDSPGQLALIKMDPQKMQGVEGRRFLFAKEPHIFANPIYGTDPKAMRLFKFEQKGARGFRLISDTDLTSGEYCFFFTTGPNTGGKKGAASENLTLWDFGID
ncbi:MAG: hypothetical protein ABSE86_34150 [Bryobacteraceae bacterium]